MSQSVKDFLGGLVLSLLIIAAIAEPTSEIEVLAGGKVTKPAPTSGNHY